MKLSDKLAALEAAEKAATRSKDVPTAVAKPGQRVARAVEKGPNKWSDAKRKVRDLVLAEIGPKLSGPKALKGASLEKEVKACLDRILRRRVEQGAAMLSRKLDFLLELGERIHELRRRGLDEAEIARALPGNDLFWRVWTGGDFSKRNFVRAFSRQA